MSSNKMNHSQSISGQIKVLSFLSTIFYWNVKYFIISWTWIPVLPGLMCLLFWPFLVVICEMIQLFFSSIALILKPTCRPPSHLQKLFSQLLLSLPPQLLYLHLHQIIFPTLSQHPLLLLSLRPLSHQPQLQHRLHQFLWSLSMMLLISGSTGLINYSYISIIAVTSFNSAYIYNDIRAASRTEMTLKQD